MGDVYITWWILLESTNICFIQEGNGSGMNNNLFHTGCDKFNPDSFSTTRGSTWDLKRLEANYFYLKKFKIIF